jgi:hypothetical protein
MLCPFLNIPMRQAYTLDAAIFCRIIIQVCCLNLNYHFAVVIPCFHSNYHSFYLTYMAETAVVMLDAHTLVHLLSIFLCLYPCHFTMCTDAHNTVHSSYA